jgi:hypothetical protein
MKNEKLKIECHEKRNLEIHHPDDSRHSDGYPDHLGRHQLHGRLNTSP